MNDEPLPVSTAPDKVWVFVSLLGGFTGVGRLGCWCDTGVIGIFPTDLFDVHALVPTDGETGEPFPDIRWATTTDVDLYQADYIVAV